MPRFGDVHMGDETTPGEGMISATGPIDDRGGLIQQLNQPMAGPSQAYEHELSSSLGSSHGTSHAESDIERYELSVVLSPPQRITMTSENTVMPSIVVRLRIYIGNEEIFPPELMSSSSSSSVGGLSSAPSSATEQNSQLQQTQYIHHSLQSIQNNGPQSMHDGMSTSNGTDDISYMNNMGSSNFGPGSEGRLNAGRHDNERPTFFHISLYNSTDRVPITDPTPLEGVLVRSPDILSDPSEPSLNVYRYFGIFSNYHITLGSGSYRIRIALLQGVEFSTDSQSRILPPGEQLAEVFTMPFTIFNENETISESDDSVLSEDLGVDERMMIIESLRRQGADIHS
ncbi:hypothetical protein V1511DRAFT_511416 [Dipodascopsis uninucleata]